MESKDQKTAAEKAKSSLERLGKENGKRAANNLETFAYAATLTAIAIQDGGIDFGMNAAYLSISPWENVEGGAKMLEFAENVQKAASLLEKDARKKMEEKKKELDLLQDVATSYHNAGNVFYGIEKHAKSSYLPKSK